MSTADLESGDGQYRSSREMCSAFLQEPVTNIDRLANRANEPLQFGRSLSVDAPSRVYEELQPFDINQITIRGSYPRALTLKTKTLLVYRLTTLKIESSHKVRDLREMPVYG